MYPPKKIEFFLSIYIDSRIILWFYRDILACNMYVIQKYVLWLVRLCICNT